MVQKLTQEADTTNSTKKKTLIWWSPRQEKVKTSDKVEMIADDY